MVKQQLGEEIAGAYRTVNLVIGMTRFLTISGGASAVRQHYLSLASGSVAVTRRLGRRRCPENLW